MKAFIVGVLACGLSLSSAFVPAWAVKTSIEASGNVAMNKVFNEYKDNVLQIVTKECLAQNAAKQTEVSLTVDAHGNIMRVVLANSGLEPGGVVNLINSLRALKLGDAGENQSDTLRITMDFDLAEVLAGAKSTGTSISIKGGSITGDGTATGGIRIGGGGSIRAGGGAGGTLNFAAPASAISVHVAPQPVRQEDLSKLAELEKKADASPQELCDARLTVVEQYWRSGEQAKSREILGQALKYLEGPSGPLSPLTSHLLERSGREMLFSYAPGDEDLVWRTYAIIEKKSNGGCSMAFLARLSRSASRISDEKAGAQVLSLLSRILELREMRDGLNSAKLIPVLDSIATTDDTLNKHDAAALIKQRIASIQALHAAPPAAN